MNKKAKQQRRRALEKERQRQRTLEDARRRQQKASNEMRRQQQTRDREQGRRSRITWKEYCGLHRTKM